MRSLARWGTLPLLAAPLGSWALGLGDIESNSYLNQSMNAEIPFSATPEELASLRVSLAPVDAFLEAGIDYPGFMSSFEFNLQRNDAGQNVIVVTSDQAIVEPFVTMLVQVTHARGSLTREYTVLLDPPLFLPAEAEAPPIAAPVTRDAEPDAAGPIVRESAVATPEPSAQSQPEPRPVAQADTAAGGDYTVQAGDTLWGIANRNRPSGVSTNQAMISIYDANPSAFVGNINRLRGGVILRIPSASALGAVVASEATAEVRRQNNAWQNAVEPAPQLVLRPPSDEIPAGSAGSETDAAAAARVDALENDVSGLEAELTDAETQLAEAQRLIEIQSQELADLQRQLDAAAAETAPEVDSDVLFVDEQEPAAEVEQPSESVAVVPPAARGAPQPSLGTRALEFVTQPFVLIGGGVVLLVLLALAFLRRRLDDADETTGQWEALEAELNEEADAAATPEVSAQAEEPDMVVVEGHADEVTAEEPQLDALSGIDALEPLDLGTSEIEALTDIEEDLAGIGELDSEDEPASESGLSDDTLSSQTVINLDQADPIAEADFHMAYGLYDQAADLLTNALDGDPENREFKLKLLEVYFVWGNKEQFLECATGLHQLLGEDGSSDWDKAIIMGKQICPDEALFSEATAAAGEVDLDLESTGSAAALDFAFDAEESEGSDLSLIDDGETLDIGEQTQAGLKAAILDETDDGEDETTLGAEVHDPDETMDSLTIEAEAVDERTVETEAPDESTVETEGLDMPTVETPTIEVPPADIGDTVEHKQTTPAGGTADMTAELEIDDLGLDVGDLEDLSVDIADLADDAEQDVQADQDLLSATGVTAVLDPEVTDIDQTGTGILGDDEETLMAPGDEVELAVDASTEVLQQPASDFDPEPVETEEDLDLNLDDFSAALDGGDDTVEQPIVTGLGDDLDIGDDAAVDDAPTGTEEIGPLDPQTMTEVGTKLDLARAYIDMGDPEGAKSILEEVLSEGDAGQRAEAQALIDTLSA